MSTATEIYERVRQEYPLLKKYKGRYTELTLKQPKTNRCFILDEEQNFDNYIFRINNDVTRIIIGVHGAVEAPRLKANGRVGKRTFDRGIVHIDTHYIKVWDVNAWPREKSPETVSNLICEYIARYTQPEVRMEYAM